jgi:starch synthase
MKIAFAASEVFPYAKTGGLGDVAGALPNEISKLGHEIKVFMPKYNTFDEIEFGLKYQWEIGTIQIRVAGKVHDIYVYTALMPETDVQIYFVDCKYYFYREKIYTNDKDEDERFILFSKAVIEILQRLQWAPDVIHCNDWQTGLLPLLLKENYSWDTLFVNTSTIFTIHNIAYQGRFLKEAFSKAEIRKEHYLHGGIGEYAGGVNFIKTAIFSSDIINTVSETYASELLTPEYGEGMESYLASRKKDFYGILNGVDYNIWNPELDKVIPYKFSINDLSGKLKNKKALLNLLHIPFDENIPLIGIVSRLVAQKGFDILAEAINELMEMNAYWVVLGGGEPEYEKVLKYMAYYYPDKVYIQIGYNNELAHLIEAGADIFLMPSRFEPCGLNQIYSLKYGTVPVVRKTGGLADTVQDWNELLARGLETGTGYSFNDYSPQALIQTIKRAIHDFDLKDVWNKIRLNGMSRDYSWKRSAEKYIDLYEKAILNRKTKIPLS